MSPGPIVLPEKTSDQFFLTGLNFPLSSGRDAGSAEDADPPLHELSLHRSGRQELRTRRSSGREGKEPPHAEIDKMYKGIVDQFERESTALYGTAHLWDDGIIDPLDTRRVLALGLAAARNAPIPETTFGIFRM